MKITKTPERKSLEYLLKNGWQFDSEESAEEELKYAFRYAGNSRNDLVPLICILWKKDWFLYSLSDIETLNQARIIYRKNFRET